MFNCKVDVYFAHFCCFFADKGEKVDSIVCILKEHSLYLTGTLRIKRRKYYDPTNSSHELVYLFA